MSKLPILCLVIGTIGASIFETWEAVPAKLLLTDCQNVVVGGGFAGLYSAFLLSKMGQGSSTCLFEAQDRLGGRIFDHQDGDGTWQGLGALRVDRSHQDVIDLTRELGIKLDRQDHTGLHTFTRGWNATNSLRIRDLAFPYDPTNRATALSYATMRDYMTALPGIGSEGFEFVKAAFRFRAHR